MLAQNPQNGAKAKPSAVVQFRSEDLYQGIASAMPSTTPKQNGFSRCGPPGQQRAEAVSFSAV
jgi:hypothetical protein